MTRFNRIRLAVALSVLACVAVVAYRVGAAGIPATNTMYYTGSLMTFGAPDNGTHAMSVALFVSGASTSACASSAMSVTCVNGQFSFPLPAACVPIVHANPNLEVQVTVDSTILAMTPLSAVPYAVEADTASNAAPGSALAALQTTVNTLQSQVAALQNGPRIVNYQYATTNTASTPAGTFPWNNSAPQSSGGNLVVSVTFTPAAATDLLVFDGQVNWSEGSINSSDYVTIALFQSSATGAIFSAVDSSSNGNGRCTANGSYPIICTQPFHFVMPAGTTGQTTYTLKIGMDGEPVWINSGFNGQELGGTLYSDLSVMEIVP